MSHKQSTLTDFVTNYIAGNFSVRPDTLDNVGTNVRLAVIELQKNNLFPETTISFTSLDMKDEKRDSSDELIWNFYTLPSDFRQLYNKGPAFEVDEKDKIYSYKNYPLYLRIYKSSDDHIFTLQQYNDEFGKRFRLIAKPFPDDDHTVHVTYYSNGVDMAIDDIEPEYYMAVINHVLNQLGLKRKSEYQENVSDIKRNRNNRAGQGSHHDSFTKTPPRFFGKHRTK